MLAYLAVLKGWLNDLVEEEGLRKNLYGMFGDQLTVAMIRNAQGLVENADDPLDWFSFLISLPGDFHPRMNVHDVSLLFSLSCHCCCCCCCCAPHEKTNKTEDFLSLISQGCFQNLPGPYVFPFEDLLGCLEDQAAEEKRAIKSL